MAEGRPKLYKVRRLVSHKDIEGVECAGTYEYLEIDPVGYSWVEDPMDASALRLERAKQLKDMAREACQDPNITYHCVVEA